MSNSELILAAIQARKNAYAPYSHFAVGAAVLTREGRIFTGCNIENASYGATNCAERCAIFKAVSEGDKELVKIAVVGGKIGEEITEYAYPCGVCRQVIGEFCNVKEMKVIVAKSETEYAEFTLDELLPHHFGGHIWSI